MSEINNFVLKTVVAKMSEGGLSPKTITDNYAPVVKMVVASAVDEQGEEIFPRKLPYLAQRQSTYLISDGRSPQKTEELKGLSHL